MSQSISPTQRAALAAVCHAIIETVTEAEPIGAPGGVIYAALSAQGCTFSQYTSLMGGLVSTGRLTFEDDCYHIPQAQAAAAE